MTGPPLDPHDAVFAEIRARARDGRAALADASQVNVSSIRPKPGLRATLLDLNQMTTRGMLEGGVALAEAPGAMLQMMGAAPRETLTPQMQGISGAAQWLFDHTTLREGPRLAQAAREAIRARTGDPQTEAGRWGRLGMNVVTQLVAPVVGFKAGRRVWDVLRGGGAGRNPMWLNPQGPKLPPETPLAPEVPPVNPANLTPGQTSFLDDLAGSARKTREPTPMELIIGHQEAKLGRPIPSGAPPVRPVGETVYPTGLGPGSSRLPLTPQRTRTLLSRVLGVDRGQINILPPKPPFRGPQPPPSRLPPDAWR